MIWKLLLITIALIGIAVAMIAIKMFIKKDSTFKKTCSSTLTDKEGKKMSCGCSGDCENYNLHHGKSTTTTE